MDKTRPHLSLRAPHLRAKRFQPVSHVFNVAATRVLLRRVVVPTVASSAKLLQGHGLLAQAAFLESLLASVPPQLPVLPEAGWVLLPC